MTDRRQALVDLRDKVEANDHITASDCIAAFSGLGYDEAINATGWAIPANKGSIDAAKALHEAVLPGWHYGLYDDNGIGFSEAQVEWCNWEGEPINGQDKCIARAWLLAILEALITQAPTPAEPDRP